MVHPKEEEHHKGGTGVPETKGVAEGSAKRNIARKHNPFDQKEKKNHGGAGGKGKWSELDDGSMTYDDVYEASEDTTTEEKTDG